MANNVAYAYSWLKAKGFSRSAAAGIVGNLVQESGVNPKSVQSGGPGRGIAQWSEGQRWSTLQNWAKGKGLDPWSLDTQLQFMLREMNGMGLTERMIGMTDYKAATKLFMDVFERPAAAHANLSGRYQYASNSYTRNPSVKTSASDKGVTANAGGGGGGGGGMAGGQRFNRKEFEATLAEAGWSAALIESDKELEKIFRNAVSGKWTPQRFIGAIKSSDWYQERTKSERWHDALKFNDREEWKNEREKMLANFRDQAAAAGVEINDNRMQKLANFALRSGLDESQLRDLLAKEFKYRPAQEDYSGIAGGAIDDIQEMAYQYDMNLSKQQIERWTRRIVAGDADMTEFKDFAVQAAKRNYSWLGDELDRGRTVQDLVDPYRQTMAQVLEINPEQIKARDRLLKPALQFDVKGDGKTYGLMPQWQFEEQLKKDPRWMKTKNAREQVMGNAYSVLRDFGLMS